MASRQRLRDLMVRLRTPAGTRDVLPMEAAELRIIEDSVRRVFLGFGYGEIVTPTMEYEEVLALSEEAALLTGFRMLDEHGELLLLRPDLTTPIARLVAGRLRNGTPPHRLFTVSNVFRRISPQRGREMEFRQAGVELLGGGGPEADAEVMAVACRGLDAAGLQGYRVGVGHVELFQELLQALQIEAGIQRELLSCLVGKDFVGYRLAVDGLYLGENDRSALLRLPEMRGGPEVLEEARDLVRSRGMEEALGHLEELSSALDTYGYGDRLLYDLGIFRNLEYYTGIVFELYAAELGVTLGGGGRYDNLLARFGASLDAVGFGVGLDRMHAALLEQGGEVETGPVTVLMPGGQSRWVRQADLLRAEGFGVFAVPEDVQREDLTSLSRQKEIRLLVETDPAGTGAEWVVSDLELSVETRCSVEKLPGAIRGISSRREGREA